MSAPMLPASFFTISQLKDFATIQTQRLRKHRLLIHRLAVSTGCAYLYSAAAPVVKVQ